MSFSLVTLVFVLNTLCVLPSIYDLLVLCLIVHRSPLSNNETLPADVVDNNDDNDMIKMMSELAELHCAYSKIKV